MDYQESEGRLVLLRLAGGPASPQKVAISESISHSVTVTPARSFAMFSKPFANGR